MKIWLSHRPVNDRQIPTSYDEAMNQTMNTMMQAMPDLSRLSYTDRAFAWVMIPHHQAAIDMAKVLLLYSQDGVTTSFCEHLISSEQMEIEQMLSFIKSGENEK
jgi:uncharacterized protein (DUF305 family)